MPGLRFVKSVGALSLLLPSAAFAAGGGGEGHSVITSIALCMVAASALGLLMKALRQPLILGYLSAGVLIGPIGFAFISDERQISTVAEIGLILLLFMIGLEIDLKKMFAAGKLVIATGLLQFPLSLAAGYGLFSLLAWLGWTVGEGPFAPLYAACAISISSTMIVVKLLYDKRELDTLAGRITVGILIFQDIWAIIALALQPNLSNPTVESLARTLGAGALLVAFALVASRYVLPHLFRLVAKVPEMMMVLSLGWCFLVGLLAAHPRVGLSMEMGALIAGVSLATFPYNLDVIAKVLSIRDFFITLFFVALGMQIPVPELGAVLAAIVVGGVLVMTRFLGVFGVLHALRAGHYSSLLPTLNLSQMSEFALVIIAMGIQLGHVGRQSLTVALWAFSLLAVASTYQIAYSHKLERYLSRTLKGFGFSDVRTSHSEVKRAQARSIVILGFFRIAWAFVDEIRSRDQHLFERLKVIDFNPVMRDRLRAIGIPCIYGDIAHPDTLHHAGIEEAQVLISTVPDGALRGTSNAKLLQSMRAQSHRARIIVTAETPEQARELYALGADYVIQPNQLAGENLITVVEQALRGSTEGLKEEATAKFDVAATLRDVDL